MMRKVFGNGIRRSRRSSRVPVLATIVVLGVGLTGLFAVTQSEPDRSSAVQFSRTLDSLGHGINWMLMNVTRGDPYNSPQQTTGASAQAGHEQQGQPSSMRLMEGGVWDAAVGIGMISTIALLVLAVSVGCVAATATALGYATIRLVGLTETISNKVRRRREYVDWKWS